MTDADGHVVVDPGHATEFAGFLAELVRICGQGRALLDAALAIDLFSHRIGFTAAGVMTKYADLDTEEERVQRVDLCRRQIDTMLDLGGVVWGSHADKADATLVKSYEDLARHVEGTRAVIAVENFGGEGKWVEDRMEFLDLIDHPQVGMILDIGHVRDDTGANPMASPGGPTRVVELCGHRLRHVHLHGFKDGEDHHPPLVDGDTIQWVELFRALRAVGYPGDMNFEPSGEPLHRNTLEFTALAPARIVEMAAGAGRT